MVVILSVDGPMVEGQIAVISGARSSLLTLSLAMFFLASEPATPVKIFDLLQAATKLDREQLIDQS